MRFHKPYKTPKMVLTESPGWCIIYRMFVFGRSVPRVRNKTQETRTVGLHRMGRMKFDAAQTQEAPHLLPCTVPRNMRLHDGCLPLTQSAFGYFFDGLKCSFPA